MSAAWHPLLESAYEELAAYLRAKLGRIEERGKLLEDVRGCERLIRKGKLKEARSMLAARGEALVLAGLGSERSRLKTALRWAPLDLLVDRLNMGAMV